MTKSSLELADEQAAVVQKTPNRVTLEQLEASIATVEYLNPEYTPQLTIAVVTLTNGFTVIGESACADPGNFDKNLGRKFALEDAKRKIWPLMAYALCNKLRAE